MTYFSTSNSFYINTSDYLNVMDLNTEYSKTCVMPVLIALMFWGISAQIFQKQLQMCILYSCLSRFYGDFFCQHFWSQVFPSILCFFILCIFIFFCFVLFLFVCLLVLPVCLLLKKRLGLGWVGNWKEFGNLGEGGGVWKTVFSLKHVTSIACLVTVKNTCMCGLYILTNIIQGNQLCCLKIKETRAPNTEVKHNVSRGLSRIFIYT